MSRAKWIRLLYGFAAAAALAGGALLLNNYNVTIPPEHTLTRFGGTVVKGDSAAHGGAEQPAAQPDEGQFTLLGAPEVFEISTTLPDWVAVYERMGPEVELWADLRAQGMSAPLTVYAIEQRADGETTIGSRILDYQTVSEHLAAQHRRFERLGAFLVFLGACFFVSAKVIDILHRFKDEIES